MENLKACYEMLTFKSVTSLPRVIEIGLGVLAWINIGIIVYGINELIF